MLNGECCVFRIQYAFQYQRAAPGITRPVDIFPGDGLIELRIDEARDGEHVVLGAGGADEICQGRLGSGEKTHQPAGMHGEVDEIGEAQLRRNGEPVANIAVALTLHGEIDGQGQHRAAGVACAFHHCFCQPAIAQHVELKPDRPLHAFRHDLDAGGRHRAEAERRAGLVCSERCF